MLTGGEKHFFCIWLKVETVLSVKPINDFACKGFGKFVVDKGVIYGVWLTTVDAFTVCTYPILAKFFLCSNNPMDKFEFKFFQLISFACF